MRNNVCVYRHRRLDTNEIFYVGIGDYKRPYKKSIRSQFWKNIINKTNYQVEIIAENLDWETACELEEFLISLYGRKDLNTGTLCNLTNGGEGACGYIMTNERKLELSKKRKGIKFSKETCNNISKARQGMKFSNKHKENLSKNSGMSRKVIDTSTGIIYNSVTEVVNLFPVSMTGLTRYLKGIRKNKTTFEYYEIK